jgi:hypothetical protein
MATCVTNCHAVQISSADTAPSQENEAQDEEAA